MTRRIVFVTGGAGFIGSNIVARLTEDPALDVVVCDRSVLDNYAYLMLAFGRQLPIERFMHHWMKGYDLLFKVPFSGQLAADGVRDTDTFFAEAVDQLVDQLCGWGEEVSHNAIEVYVHRLRKKIEPGGVKIATVRGLGYCLERPQGE